MSKEEIRELILEWVEFTSEKNKFPSTNHFHSRYLKTQVDEFIKTKHTEDDYSGLPSPQQLNYHPSYDKEQADNKEKYSEPSVRGWDYDEEDDY